MIVPSQERFVIRGEVAGAVPSCDAAQLLKFQRETVLR
jgi:hypothetical protein